MAITDTVITPKQTASVAALLLALSPAFSQAGDWQFTPELTLDETWSDNVELTQNDKISSLVSQVGVALEQTYKAQYAEFNFNSHSIYAMYSHDSSINDDYHTVDTDLRYTLWPKGITLFANANLSQRTRNNVNNSLADIVSGDLIDHLTYRGGAEYSIQNSRYSLDTSLAYNVTDSSDNIGNYGGVLFNLFTENGSNSNRLFWQATASYQTREDNNQDGEFYQAEVKLGYITSWDFVPFIRYYDEDNTGSINQGRTFESRSYGAGFRWFATPRLYVDISYNKPSEEQVDIDGEELEEYIDARIDWQPTRRTRLTAGFSQRFYGDSYEFSLEHRNKRLSNTISYTETAEAFTRDNYEVVPVGFFWCPSGQEVNAEQCYLQGNSDINFDDYDLIVVNDFEPVEDYQFSLNRRLSWHSKLTLRRTELSFRANGNRRIGLEDDQEDETLSTTFSVRRKVSQYSSFDLSATYNQNDYDVESPNERNDKYIRYQLEYQRTLNDDLETTFGASHLDRDSSLDRNTYQEVRVYFTVTKGF